MRWVCVIMRRTHVGRQCVCVRTGSKRPTFKTPMNRAHITFIAERKCLYVERSWSVRVWMRSDSDLWVGRASYSWNTAPFFARMRRHDVSVIVNDTCTVHVWFVRDFYPRHPENLVNFSTHKHAQTLSVRELWVICAWSAVWLALKLDKFQVIKQTQILCSRSPWPWPLTLGSFMGHGQLRHELWCP